ncbi:uncharacterized protein [Panulirus ornatus]|uniref:uncharacterized protein isoform X2 n=1 Tax=Panulirus ornatus TaxID=150431 RepID=UPI003A86E47E
MPGRKKAKGRGRQNQSRNKSHNQVVRQPSKGQSNDQHSDTDSQANAVEKEDVSSESASNGQYEDISSQASGPPEVLNQHQLEVKDDDEQEEESQIDDTSNDCSIDQEDSSAGVSYQVTAHDVFEEHQPDENYCDDQPDENYSDDQQEDQDSKSNSLDEQAKFDDTSNENSPLKSMIEQQYIQNIIDEQQLEGSLPLLVRESLFAQIAANSPYKRELEEYSPHRQDKRPIKQQRIEPDCKNHSDSQQEKLHCELKQEEQDEKCQDDQLPLDEQDCNSKHHFQQECQQSCSKDVLLYSDKVKLRQEGMDKQLTIKTHEVSHIREDEVHSDEKDQKSSNQHDQHYDAKQDEEVKVKSYKEIETKCNEQVMINHEEEQQVRKIEGHDSMQNIQLSAKQKGVDHAEEDEKLIAQEIEQPEAKQNEHLNSKEDEQLATRPNEELAAELDEKLNAEHDGKQNEQFATKLNEELVVEQGELLDNLIGEADAQLIEKSVSESCEEHDTKHYECPTGKVDDEYDIKVNEGLDSEQRDQVGLQEIDEFDIKVDNEIDAKLMEKQLEELNLVSDNAGHNDEFDVRHSEGLPDEISEQYCIMKAKKLNTEEVEKLGVEHISKLEAKQNEQLDDQENNHPVKEIEQLIAKQIEPLDAKANDEICTRQKEQQFTKQNKQFDIKQISHLDGKQSEHCIIEHIEYFNFNLDEVVAAQKEELYSKQIEERDDQQNEQICEKQNDKPEADLDLESDVKENEDLDAKTIGKLSVVLDDAIVCEQLCLEQNEELDVREDKDLILKEHEPNVQQSEELIVGPYELLTLKPNVQFSVKQNDELEVKVNKYFDGKKNEVLEYTVSDDVVYLNQRYGEKQNDVDVFLNDKLSSEGIEDEDVKVNRGDQIEHFTIKKNEEIRVIAGAQPNEDLDSKKVEKLGNTQVQDTDSKQCQGINALYKKEEFKEIVLHETEGKQEQEINCNQDQELDGKQDQEVYGKHDLELDGKQDQELNGKQDQDDNGIQYQELAGTQDEELGGKHGQEDHGKQNEDLDGKQGQEAHGKEDQELYGKNDQELDSKQDQELDSKQDQDVNSKQDQELDDEQGQELNGIQNLDLDGMQDQGLDGKQDQELDCKEDPEVNGKQDQESNGNQDLDDEQDQELAVLHYPEVTVQQNQRVEADQSELCFSKQVDMIASDEGKDCNSKQDKTFGNKQNEEYRNGKADCQLYDRKQMKCSGMGERTNQQDRDKQECEHKGKFSQQDPVANRLLLSVTKNNDSKTNSNLNKRHTQDYLGIDEPTHTHENQKYIYHQGEIESAENYDDEQHNCSFQQTDHLAFNQSKQYNGELTKARNFKQNEERHDCKVNQFYAGKEDEPTGINEYVNQEQEGKQECEFKEEKPQQEDHMQRALWKSQSYEKSSLTDRQPELNDYHDCKDVQQEEVKLADNCYDIQYNLSCFHKRDDQQSDVKEIHHHNSTQVLQNNHSLDKHEFLACGQAEKVNNKYEIKTSKHEEKQEFKQDDREGERKSFSKQSNQQNVSKQDQNFRVNQYRGKQQYSSRKGFQGGYNKSWNNQKGYQHEYQQKWDQKYHRGYRNCQNNQRHYHQQQAKPQGTSQSGGLVCGVCEEKYDRRNRMPRNLYCGHTVCTSCAWRLLKHFIIVCPQCRTKTLRVSSADKLTINMPLIAILTEEASTKPIVPVSNNEGPESQPYSTEVGATGGQQFDSSLKHTEKAIVTELLSITLRSLLTSTAENGVVSQIVACQETPTDKKFSQLTVNGARMHLHSLSGITTLKEARALPLECFMVCLDSKSTLTFLDLFWDGTSQGRVYIRLTGNTARGRQFLSLCTGEKGPTFRNTHFHRVWWKGHAGEHVWGGDYDQGDGSGGATLPSNCSGEDAEAELGCAVPITPGLVAGRYEKKDVSSIFRIYTREAKHCMEEAAFGHVEHGLSVVEKAINHNIIQDVIISDCGVVMDI